MKPLSTKTLQKKYIKARISESESVLLHKYMLCFSNLYGCIQIKDLWNVFKQYKENITKEKFFDFIDITQREENEYLVVNLNEAYTGETSTETKDKLLVNKCLIKRFDLKFWYLQRLEKFKDVRHGPFVPKKEELLKFDHDVFYENKAGKEMVSFISNLKTSGIERNKHNEKMIPIVDLNGNSVKDKYLKDIICYSDWERFEINYYKNEKKKEYLIEQYNITCAKKALNLIKRYVLIGESNEAIDTITTILDYLIYDLGVDLSKDEANKFLSIYMELTNSSYRWSIYGWSPNEIVKTTPFHRGPIELQIGPNMQKMIDNGEYNLEEMENFFKENKLDVRITKQKGK